MVHEAIVLSMLLRRDPDTGRWEKVWPHAAPMLSDLGAPIPGAVHAVSVPRDPPARIGDRLIVGERTSELVRRCGPIELPSIQFVERVYRQQCCDDSNRDRIDAAIAAYEVWLVQPVVPGETSAMAAAEAISEFPTLS